MNKTNAKTKQQARFRINLTFGQALQKIIKVADAKAQGKKK